MLDANELAEAFSRSKRILYIPFYVKVAIFIALSSVIIVSIVLSVYFVRNNNTEFLKLSVSTLQFTGIIFIIVLVLFFSESNMNANDLIDRQKDFLKNRMVDQLSKITTENFYEEKKIKCRFRDFTDIFGALYYLYLDNDLELKIWVGVNVNKIIVIYFIKDKCKDECDVENIFSGTISGAEKSGYKFNVDRALVGSDKIISMWFTTNLENDFLTSPSQKLFWANDVSMMTQSFLRTARRNEDKIERVTHVNPQPLSKMLYDNMQPERK